MAQNKEFPMFPMSDFKKLTDTETHNFLNNKEIFPEFKNGPLNFYRKKSTFDYRKLRLLIEDSEAIELAYKFYKYFETEPSFDKNDYHNKTLDETRRISCQRMMKLKNYDLFNIDQYYGNVHLLRIPSQSIISYDPSCAVKHSLSAGMFPNVLQKLASSELEQYIIDNDLSGKMIGSFGLTEIAHGSNVRGMRTMATYDNETKEFVLHSPDFEAAKCWVGNLGKSATHMVCYAQMYTNNGKTHNGLFPFYVPIRDLKTFKPYNGVIVGDMGAKIGINGVDNGFVMFNQYRIPAMFLLSRNGNFNNNGEFISEIKDKNKSHSVNFTSLSIGRVNICNIATTYFINAITIAVRYAGSRKQFGANDTSEELPILEYQAQQHRLIPHLASAFALKIFSKWIFNVLYEGQLATIMSSDKDLMALKSAELHAISSVTKPVCTWTARNGIQECREACGGHGYLKISGIGDIRDNNDANCTYEGENNLLIQQGSNWLLSIWNKGYDKFDKFSPYGTVSFVKNAKEICNHKFSWNNSKDATELESILKAFNWLLVYLLEQTNLHCEKLRKIHRTAINVKNESQVFYAKELSIVYAERNLFSVSYEFIAKLPLSPERTVLENLIKLYGTNLLLTHIDLLCEGEFIQPKQIRLYKDAILNLLSLLKNEAISLIDVIAPPDAIIGSPLGMSDGNIYQHLQAAIFNDPDCFNRPSWWRETLLKSKL